MSLSQSLKIHGVHTALFTPLINDDPKRLANKIDYEKAKVMIDDLIEAGVDGIVPVGTTGQSATLTHVQHLEFIRFVNEYVNGRVQIIAGAGSNCTRESVEMIKAIQSVAKIPVLCVTGYYNNPSREGLILHFKTLAEETGAEIVLYNVPSRTNSYLDADAVVELAKVPNIIGLKQAVDFKIDGEHRQETLKIIKETKELDFALLSGEDDAFAQLLQDGGHGLISATANIVEAAKLFIEIKDLANSNDFSKLSEIQASLAQYVKAVFIRKNPIPLGALFNSPLYQPLCSVLETENGLQAQNLIMDLIETKAESLKKYH
jgi:4-hydroxy-tetrahydrodipicolinate synthase